MQSTKDKTRHLLTSQRKASVLGAEKDAFSSEFYRCLGFVKMPLSEIKRHMAELERRGIGFDPVMNELSREEQLAQHFKIYAKFNQYAKEQGVLTDPQKFDTDLSRLLKPWMQFGTNAFNLHWLGFYQSIKMLGTKEQQAKWVPLARQTQIIGCYAQTELGHGSDVMNLETTATYDKERQVFILNSPTLTSTKFWPGCMGHMANHGLIVAQLYTQGKRRGVQTFIAQIRDTSSHKPMPGIELGDIADKFAMQQSDNGWLRFKNYEIPRENMLMRFAMVTPEGEYIPPDKKEAKLVYASMLTIRVQFLMFCAFYCACASTVAVRYGVQRTQFRKQKGSKEERKILDYQAQQAKLVPILSSVWAFLFTADKVRGDYNSFFEGVNAQHSGKGKKFSKGAFQKLPDLHSTASGVKAFVSDLTLEHLNVALHSCGGHGFLEQSGFSYYFRCSSAYPTMEGDNTVLYQQTARYLLKCDQNNGKIRAGTNVEYLKEKETIFGEVVRQNMTVEEILSPAFLLKAFRRRALWQLGRVTMLIAEKVGEGIPMLNIWNEYAQQDLIKLAEYHTQGIVVQDFINAVKRFEVKGGIVLKVFEILRDSFITWLTERESGSLIRAGGIRGEHLEVVHGRWIKSLSELRPHMVTLVDSFIIRDGLLSSTIGHSEGGIYERIMDHVIHKNPTAGKDSYTGFEKHIRPLLKPKL